MATTTNFGWETPDDTDLVKDGAAAMRTLGNSIDTSFVDLKGGTSGQMLTKASNTDLDYTWVTPEIGDITAITVTSPITGGGTTGSVGIAIQDATTSVKGAVQLTDSTSSTSTTTAATPNSVKSAYDLANAAIPKSTATTAGDLLYRDGSGVTRLGIGTAGQVLTVNSGATAPQWSAASGSGSMTLLSTTTLSGGTTTISSISGSYKKLIAVINGLSLSVDQASVHMRLNGDTGSNYDSSAWDGSGNMVLDSVMYIMGNVDAPTSVNGMEITIPDYANTNSYKYLYGIGAGIRGVDVPARYNITGHWASTSAITSISFIASTGNIDAGTVYLYGVN